MHLSKGTRIPGLKRKPKREGGYFDDLPVELRDWAERWLQRMIEKRRRLGKEVKDWVYPLLVGQAKRLAQNPADSAWGRSMRAKKGGHAVQRRYRREGRDPTAKATRVRRALQGKPISDRLDYPGLVTLDPIHHFFYRPDKEGRREPVAALDMADFYSQIGEEMNDDDY